jgi:hypothetical protein
MALDPEIGRVNVLLEYLAECAETNDLAAFIHVAGGRVRWVLDFERFTLVIRGPSDCQYWTVCHDAERLGPIAPEALPPMEKEMISTVLLQGCPLASARPIRGLCLPLQTMDLKVGAICFTNARGHYSYRDERFAHQIAQFFSGTSARRLQAETIRRQASELESAIRSKDEFLAILGHELRNPLAPILLSVELLDRRLGDPPPRELAVIKRQAQHLVRLVDDLLDVARVTRGSLELVSSPVETSTVVARAIEMASPLIEARRHRLEVDVPAKGLCIDGDESRLAQVISNLLTNAARYTRSGGLIRSSLSEAKSRSSSRSATTVAGSRPISCRRCSRCSSRRRRARETPESGWAWGWPSSSRSPSCTAVRCPCRALGRDAEAPSPCGFRGSRRLRIARSSPRSPGPRRSRHIRAG